MIYLGACDIAQPRKSRAKIQSDYRARKREGGGVAASGKSGKVSLWQKADFIALDGEGENCGPKESFSIGDDERIYYAQDHKYTLLADSKGGQIYSKQRLETQSALDYLCDLGCSNRRSLFVIFAGGYDINHILMHGFSRRVLKHIASGEEHQFEHKGEWYSIEYRARKSLTVRRGKEWIKNKKGKMHLRWKTRIVVWDVFGFFQESFVGVMAKWLGADHRHYKLISDMKKRRGDFANVPQAQINAYNRAELESLVELMQKVHAAIDGLGLKVNRWDGAGSIASAMFRKHEVKKYKSDFIPPDASFAARCAYAGGRIEICKIGFHDGPVYDYDINSAYPSVMQNVPCLKCGVWRHGKGALPPPGFTLVKTRYNFMKGQRFYPLFFRTRRMQISFPSDGCGWYWYPEYEAALSCFGNVDCLEWWHFEPRCDHKPFSWIGDYYETRKQWLKTPTEDWQGGGEKIIKLGLNSLYGKCAQQLGGTDTSPPSYHQIEWAGYITSATRARLFTAANTNPVNVIGFATDGLFTTRPLIIDHGLEKKIGAWELKHPLPQGMTIAMAGVYWWHLGDNKFTHFSRGFDKDAMRTPHKICEAWAKGESMIDVPMYRLIGMGSACASDTMWKMRGRFAESMRSLRLDGYSHKRAAIDIKKQKPHRQLIDLDPKPNAEYGYDMQEISHPYPLKWEDGDGGRDAYENDLELSRENEDTANI